MTEMTKKQSERFVEFYKWLYWDTSKKLPTIFSGDEELHRNMWKLELTKILGKTKANRSYYHRWWRKEKYIDYVFSWLWLQYWPTVLDYYKTIDEKTNEENSVSDVLKGNT